MKIAGKELRPGREAFIVAEIGINHGGSVSRAIEIIDQLHASGASFDAVKLQYYTTERLCSSAVPDETRATLKRCELSQYDTEHVLAYAKSLGYAGICTVFNIDDFNNIRTSFHVDAWKIASPDAVNILLIGYVAKFRSDMPIIVSTGTCTAEETDTLAALLKCVAPGRHAMFECVSSYPLNVSTDETVTWMAIRYPDARIGYSNHQLHEAAGSWAAEAGACLIETHVMHDDGAGVDADVSFTPSRFAEFCDNVRTCHDPFYGHAKGRWNQEVAAMLSARQSVTLRRDVAAGEVIADDNVTFKRPGTGIPAKDWYKVEGCIAAHPIKADVPIQWDDLVPSPATPAESSAASAATPKH